jgi:hypothetical protein
MDFLTDALLSEPSEFDLTLTAGGFTEENFCFAKRDSEGSSGRLQPETPWGNLTNLLSCDRITDGAQKLCCQQAIEQLAAHLPQHARGGLQPSYAVRTKPVVPKSPGGSAEVLRRSHGTHRDDSDQDYHTSNDPSSPHYAAGGRGRKRPHYSQSDVDNMSSRVDLIPQSDYSFQIAFLGETFTGLAGNLTDADLAGRAGEPAWSVWC